ncbi:MAG: PTS system mannose/fructose/sorbose family transporter subunit IID [Desulfovibrionaceae bacterium]
MTLNARTCLQCLCRTWLIGAAMTTRGMQHVGVLYALDPGLQAIYPQTADLRQARQRYSEHVNTHPFMAPLFIGIMLALEQQIAQGNVAPENITALKTTAATTLSALGDSFFSGTVLVFWVFSTTLLLQWGHSSLAIALTVLFFVLQAGFRVGTFFLGVRMGLAALMVLKRMDLINHGEIIKLINAILLSICIWRLFPTVTHHDLWGPFGVGLAALGVAAFLVARVHVPRYVFPYIFLSCMVFGLL